MKVAAVGVMLVAMLGGLLTTAAIASSETETITLDLPLGDAVQLDATVSVSELSVEDDTLTLSGSITGSATVLGQTATIETQPFTLTATISCEAATSTITLTTSEISATLDGQTVTIEPATVTVSASCGRTATLTVTAEPVTATVDGTTISTSECTLTVSSGANTTVGRTICQLQGLICGLAELLADPDVTTEELLSKLNQILSTLEDALTL